jgi:sulfite reductase alpha subunit-like flavoprotein
LNYFEGLSEEESTKIFKDIEKSGKYLKDVWY